MSTSSLSHRPALQFGVLASHEGTTLQAILDACGSGALNGQVAIVISNNSDSGALRRAREAGVPAHHLSRHTHASDAALARAILETLDSAAVRVVVLAGYMKKLGAETLARFRGRIVNTHPSLLPRHGGPGMFGMNVHRAVLAAGDAITGATVHLVTEEYDTGPVLAQEVIPVVAGDCPEELAARVQIHEQRLLIATLAGIAAGRIPLDPPLRQWVEVAIRPETSADEDAIRELTARAFAGLSFSDGSEPQVIDALRKAGALALSLVALSERRIVGHVAFSQLGPESQRGWFALGPISVDPDRQRRGVGNQLITAGLRALRERGARGCGLVGDPRYYRRFGFSVAETFAPPGEPPEYFQLLPFSGALPSVPMRFHPAFFPA